MSEQGPRLVALHAWLDQHPEAKIAALGMDALPAVMPPEIALGPGHVVESGSLLDLVRPEDRPDVATGFVTARRTGQGLAHANLLAGGLGIEIHYMDLAPELPVLVRMCVEDRQGVAAPPAPGRAGGRGRLGIITKDEAGRIVALDEGATDLLGWRAEDIVGESTLELIHPDDHEKALENWWSMHLGGGSQSVRLRYRRGDGGWLWLDTSNSYDRSERGAGSVICQVIDASREMAATDALRRNEQLLRRLAETVPVGLCVVDADRTVSYLNPRLADLLGTTAVPDVVVLEQHLTTDLDGAFAAAVAAALGEGRDGEVDVTLVRRDLPPLRCRVTLSAVVDHDEVTGVLLCVVDVTELKRQATTDPLTGLLNRQAVLGTLQDVLVSREQLTGVLFLDLDAFKPVNDVYGHRFGDQLLIAVAERLRVAVRGRDVLGRLGGDEFVVICPDLTQPLDLETVAARVQEAMHERFVLDDVPVLLGVSIGMALADDPEDSPQQVVARADAAMYAAKRQAAGPVWADPTVSDIDTTA